MTALLLFVATFGSVFALGIQSLNVNRGHERMAFLTSLFIGVFNLVILKIASQPNEWIESAAYLLGGPLGIVSAMRSHAALAARFSAGENQITQPHKT